jgi:hypothetical protein
VTPPVIDAEVRRRLVLAVRDQGKHGVNADRCPRVGAATLAGESHVDRSRPKAQGGANPGGMGTGRTLTVSSPGGL